MVGLELLLFSTVIAISLVVWQISLYFKLEVSTHAIRHKEAAFDAVEDDVAKRTANALITDSQRRAQIDVAREPILRELELLRQEREFIKDKLWFTKK